MPLTLVNLCRPAMPSFFIHRIIFVTSQHITVLVLLVLVSVYVTTLVIKQINYS